MLDILRALKPSRKKQNFLEIIAIFKNENHILKEWVEHYLSEGVQRINLINNNSTDDFEKSLEPFIRSGKVRLWHDSRDKIQLVAYAEKLKSLKKETEWLIVCDLDEFIYSRGQFPTIYSYLLSLPPEITCIQIPWKIFGSSGHIEQPKDGVVNGFQYRCDYTVMRKEYYGWYHGKIPCKYIVRPSAAKFLGCHRADLLFGQAILPNGCFVHTNNWHDIDEVLLDDFHLHVNHYALQSESQFCNVKLKRGGGVTSAERLKRSLDWFRKFDYNDRHDSELALKKSIHHF